MVVRGSDYERQDREFYPTPEWVTRLMVELHRFDRKLCDPACGDGAMTRVFAAMGHRPYGIDIKPLAKIGPTVTGDFNAIRFPFKGPIDIATNPPFGIHGKLAVEFIKTALRVTKPWKGSVGMLLPVDFDSGSTRAEIFDEHPAFYRKTTLRKRVKWFDEPVKCKKCDGKGQVMVADADTVIRPHACKSCKGEGEKMVDPSNNHALYFWDWKLGAHCRVYDYAP